MAVAPALAQSVESSGVFAGDNPLKHSLLLLIAQIVIILCFSRFLSFAFRPLRQPRVVAEIIGGILLGPTAFGRIPGFTDTFFPKSSLNVLQTVANFGLIFFLFLVGLDLDLEVLTKTGSKAMSIAAIGIVVPFLFGIPVSLQIFETTGMKHSEEHFGLPFILFMGVALSITAFPVLARILSERKIMGTEMGQIAISAAAVNDVAAWVLLALAMAVTNSKSSPLVILWVIIASAIYLLSMFLIVRPIVHCLAKEDSVSELKIAIIFLLVLLSSFATDTIGINVIFGAFIMGLMIPKKQPISEILIDKTEDFVSILLLPLYFTSSGLNVELDSISNGKAFAAFLLVTATAVVGKVVGTMVVGKLYRMGLRDSLGLGFLMSSKGLVELIVLNIGLSKGVINKEIFAIMVLMALVLTITATPMIMWLYKPARDLPPYKRRNLEAKKGDGKDKLRMLMCLYGKSQIPSIMSLTEMCKGRQSELLQVTALHLVEFLEHFRAAKMADVVKAAETWKKGCEEDLQDDAPLQDDTIVASLRTFSLVSKVQIKMNRAMSTVSSMHEDICGSAVKSQANIIILPHHKQSHPDETLPSAGPKFFQVNQRVLKESPCSVAILLDRGLGTKFDLPLVVQQQQQQLEHQHSNVLVLFFGGPDDREALSLAKRMSAHGSVKLTVVCCTFKDRPPSATLDTNLTKSFPQDVNRQTTFQVSKDRLFQLGRSSLNWLTAPWRDHSENEETEVEAEVVERTPIPPSSQGREDSTDPTQTQGEHTFPSSSTNNQSMAVDGKAQTVRKFSNGLNQHSNGPVEDNIHVFVDLLHHQNERKLDAEALRHFTAAAKDPSSGTTVKDLEIDGGPPSQACQELMETGEHDLVIVGLHSGRRQVGFGSELHQRRGSFQSNTIDHGLGVIGDWLVSKELLPRRTSMLVVWQHDNISDSFLQMKGCNPLWPAGKQGSSNA